MSKHRGMLAVDVKKKNATCYHILAYRAMLSVGVSKEETLHHIFFQDAGMLSIGVHKKNAARSPSPSVPPWDRFVEYVGSLLDVILSPRKGGGQREHL